MPPAVRWSARSAGWLWILGAALGQCLGYNSQQQKLAFLQPPGQSHLQATYVDFKPSQVTSLLHSGLGWGRVPSFVTFDVKGMNELWVGWGRGPEPPCPVDWQGLLRSLTDCSPELLTTNPINISPPRNAQTGQSLNVCGMLVHYETLCPLESNPSPSRSPNSA